MMRIKRQRTRALPRRTARNAVIVRIDVLDIVHVRVVDEFDDRYRGGRAERKKPRAESRGEPRGLGGRLMLDIE